MGAAAIVAIGYFGKNSANAWAAVIIQIPIITVFGLWAVAGSGGNEAMGAVARAAFFSAPIFYRRCLFTARDRLAPATDPWRCRD